MMQIKQSGSKQVYLPSEYSLYKQLANELNVHHPHQLSGLKSNFKQKYQNHMRMIRQHVHDIERFEESREKELAAKQRKLKEIKDYICNKQTKAKAQKQATLAKMNKKASENSIKWQSVVSSNHKEYMQALEKSLELGRKWDEKGEKSLANKKEILSRISSKNHSHNEHVNNVVAQVRLLQSQESERSISKLNPQTYPRTPKLKINFSRYQRSEKQLKKPHTRLYSHHSPSTPYMSNDHSLNNLAKLSKSISKDSLERSSRLQAKRSKDQQDIERSLLKNVDKQLKIQEARHLKSYLHQQRNRQNQERQKQKLRKLSENKKLMEHEQRSRNRELDFKFKEVRNRDVSLPIIRNKMSLQPPEQDISGGSYIYLTALDSRIQEDNSHKYDRAIMDKLRSVSLIASRKHKREAKFF